MSPVAARPAVTRRLWPGATRASPGNRPVVVASAQRCSVTQRLSAATPTMLAGDTRARTCGAVSDAMPHNANASPMALAE